MTVVAALIAVVVALLLFDLLFFARGREPSFRESAAWSLGWFVLGVAVALPLWALDGGEGAVNYLTVYLIERTLSLDNLFVFLLIFGAFAVPQRSGAAAVLGHRAGARHARPGDPHVGVRLIERFHWIIYILGARRFGARVADPARRARGRGPRTGPRRARRAPGAARGRALPRARFFARGDGGRVAADGPGARRGRDRRHRVRGRLDPRRVRHHDRAGHLDRATRSRCRACGRCSRSSG
jgi:tellurite resistance protein TerC